jgi:hypothetical protein
VKPAGEEPQKKRGELDDNIDIWEFKAKFKTDTMKAYLLETYAGDEIWFPKKFCRLLKNFPTLKDNFYWWKIPLWLAKEKGIYE